GRAVKVPPGTVGPTTVTLAKPVTPGSALIVATEVDNDCAIASVQDSLGNVYGSLLSMASAYDIHGFINATFGAKGRDDTVTVRLTGTPEFFFVYVLEYSGLAATTTLDAKSFKNGTAKQVDGMTSGPLTLSGSGELLFAFGFAVDLNGTGATAAGTGFT